MENIYFRNLCLDDMELLHKWLNTSFVIEWFGKKEMTIDAVKSKYSMYINKEKPTQAYIIQIDGIDVGYIQTYLICDYPDYNEYVKADNHAAGVDLFIGNEDFIHKGYGTSIMKTFLQKIVFSNLNVEKCIIGPEPKNTTAIRMYEKSGFKWNKNIQIPNEDEPEYIMILNKEDYMPILDE